MRPGTFLLIPTLASLFASTACTSDVPLASLTAPRPAPAAGSEPLQRLVGRWRMEPKEKDAIVPNIVFRLEPDGKMYFSRDDGGGTNFTLSYWGAWAASSPAPDRVEITFDYVGAHPTRVCFPLPGGCRDNAVPFQERWAFTRTGPDTMETPGAVWHRDPPLPALESSVPGPAAVEGGALTSEGAGFRPGTLDSGSPASDSDRAALTRPAAPAPVDPGQIDPSPDTIAAAAKEPVASDESAPLNAPVPPTTAAEPTSAPSVRAEAALPAGHFAIYFISVRSPARVSSTWRRLTERYPALAGLVLQPSRRVDIPGEGTFYTVEAGAFATRAEAQAVCDRLRSRGQSCKVLVP